MYEFRSYSGRLNLQIRVINYPIINFFWNGKYVCRRYVSLLGLVFQMNHSNLMMNSTHGCESLKSVLFFKGLCFGYYAFERYSIGCGLHF
jgi:hypothetical protein